MGAMPQLAVRDHATLLLEQGRFVEAAALLSEAVTEEESAELWNDWAVAQMNLENPYEAERGFCRALALDPGNYVAKENLGLLLYFQKRFAAALPILEQLLGNCPESSRATLTRLQTEARRYAPYSLLDPDSSATL